MRAYMTSVKELTNFFGLSCEQEEQFSVYLSSLQQWNEKMNLTAITDEPGIVSHHFADSLYASQFLDFNAVTSLADIGAGAGFPALPLKIKFPNLFVILIEVNNKKITFLKTVIDELGLKDVEIYPFDWRTFLRKTDYSLDIFVARASLQIPELLRIFNPSSPYCTSQLLYWASQYWEPGQKEKKFIERQEWYTIDKKKRKIVFFKKETE